MLSEELLKKSCTVPQEEDIQSQLQQVIDKNRFPELEKWHGKRFMDAIDLNASIKTIASTLSTDPLQKIEMNRWGEIRVQPFNGDWIKDYPQLIEHIESEHRLHIRGNDDDGFGLHWETNKFSWGLNPQYSPEARVGSSAKRGFQMKLGYFLIPSSLVEQHLANPDPSVFQGLQGRGTRALC